MTVLRTLIAARKLIENPDDWWDGKLFDLSKHYMGKHCMVTAINRVCRGNDESCYPAMKSIADCLGGWGNTSISYFNDNHTHAEVLAVFDRAIENETDISVFNPERELVNG